MASFTLVVADRADEAITVGRRAAEIAPDSLLAIWVLGLALAGASAWEEANEWLTRAIDRSSRAPFYLGLLAWCQAASGRHEQARQTLGELERRAATEYVLPLFLAWAVSELGDPEKTRRLLAEAFAERASALVHPGMPCFRRLRAEPLMEDLRRRLLGEGAEARTGS